MREGSTCWDGVKGEAKAAFRKKLNSYGCFDYPSLLCLVVRERGIELWPLIIWGPGSL